MRSEGYCTWSVHLCVSLSVLSVCLSVYLYSRTTGNEVARERYTYTQCNKCSKNNVADLAKMAAFWQEKPAPLWTTFRDPTHQLARCAWVLITRLLDWLSPCGSTARSPALLLQVPLACFRTGLSATRVCSYTLDGSCCRGCVSHLLTHAVQLRTQIVFAARLCTLVVFI